MNFKKKDLKRIFHFIKKKKNNNPPPPKLRERERERERERGEFNASVTLI